MSHKSCDRLNFEVKVTWAIKFLECLRISAAINVDVMEIQSFIAAIATLTKHLIELVIGEGHVDSLLAIGGREPSDPLIIFLIMIWVGVLVD